MPQLVPFYFMSQILFAFILLVITVYILSKLKYVNSDYGKILLNALPKLPSKKRVFKYFYYLILSYFIRNFIISGLISSFKESEYLDTLFYVLFLLVYYLVFTYIM